MLRNIAISLLCVTATFTAGVSASATNTDTVVLPTAFAETTKYRLDYSDLEGVLRGSVMEMGRSTHRRASKPTKSTSSNIRLGNNSPSRLEGNRVMLHKYTQMQIDGVAAVRDDLLAIPTQISIEKLSKNEQLAYWLNLHNIIVLAKVADLYPITRLKDTFSPLEPDSAYFARDYAWNGKMISLADIRDHVVANWSDPVVIYGFYFGAVGTPNIRTSAYTSATVYAALNDNAEEFVNSVRGTQIWNKTKLRVSTYYEANASYFPNFEEDLMAHLRKYSGSKFKNRLKKVKTFKVDIDDWNIADLYNGQLGDVAGTYAGTVTDATGNSLKSGLPEHVQDLLKDRQTKLARMKGKTSVEKVKNNKGR